MPVPTVRAYNEPYMGLICIEGFLYFMASKGVNSPALQVRLLVGAQANVCRVC
jgi:hypothetical protein